VDSPRYDEYSAQYVCSTSGGGKVRVQSTVLYGHSVSEYSGVSTVALALLALLALVDKLARRPVSGGGGRRSLAERGLFPVFPGVCGRRCVVCGVWCVVCGVWCVVWCMVVK
jgi:hypothetical protein